MSAQPDGKSKTMRFVVPSENDFDRLIRDALPRGLKVGSIRNSALQDRYFDTPDALLRRRGVSCRVRQTSVRTGDLSLAFFPLVGATPLHPTELVTAQINVSGALPDFRGRTTAEERLRLIVETVRLRAAFELSLNRRVVAVSRGWFSSQTALCCFDLITLHVDDEEEKIFEASITAGEDDSEAAEIAVWWQEHHKLVPATEARIFGVRRNVRRLRHRLQASRTGKSCCAALVVRDGDCILLHSDAEGLRMPFQRSGDSESLREFASQLGGDPESLSLLLSLPADAEHDLTEVWTVAAREGNSAGMCRTSLSALLDRAGTPAFGHGPSLAVLAALAAHPVGRALLELPATAETFDGLPLASSGTMLNADISFLDFNARVLSMAENTASSLRDRLKFLAITCSNIDEFVMVRFAALLVAPDVLLEESHHDGMIRSARVDAIRLRLVAMHRRQLRCFEECERLLNAAGVRLIRWDELNDKSKTALREWYGDRMQRGLGDASITLSPGHAFPWLPNLGLSVAAVARDERNGAWNVHQFDWPRDQSRFKRIAGSSGFAAAEEVLSGLAAESDPAISTARNYPFRITRSADLTLDAGVDLFERVEEATRRRGYNAIVRMETSADMPEPVLDALLADLRTEPGVGQTNPARAPAARELVISSRGLLGLTDVRELERAAAEAANDAAMQPALSGMELPEGETLFEKIANDDVVAHHPYDSFDLTVQRFFEAAADDDRVSAIFATLYRVGEDSPLIDALMRAVKKGKRVTVFIELTARFDERRNLKWVRRLEKSGAIVAYGKGDLKCHAKVALVERTPRDGSDEPSRFVHVGTGNYNAGTARTYTDVSMFTTDPQITADVRAFFDWVTGDQAGAPGLSCCLVAPALLLPALLQRVERETAHACAGRPALIRAKVNGLSDPELVEALYRASSAGVDVQLVVRGICTVRPGVDGLSDRIRIVSRVGTYLEHARIYHFANGGAGNDEYFLGSADWRPRNLRRRVEFVVPVTRSRARAVLGSILDAELADRDAWELQQDGMWRRGDVTHATPSAHARFVARRSTSEH